MSGRSDSVPVAVTGEVGAAALRHRFFVLSSGLANNSTCCLLPGSWAVQIHAFNRPLRPVRLPDNSCADVLLSSEARP